MAARKLRDICSPLLSSVQDFIKIILHANFNPTFIFLSLALITYKTMEETHVYPVFTVDLTLLEALSSES